MNRFKLIMLSLMDDNMAHRKEAIIDSISKMNLQNLDEVEFDELWKNTNGHGGVSVNGNCSVCIEYMKTIN